MSAGSITIVGTSLKSLVKGYLLTHQTEGSSPRTVEFYQGILNRFLWYAEKNDWPDDCRLLNEWHIREFLGYVGTEVKRWSVQGNGSESSSRKASPRTIHHYYRALTAFFNWVVREDFLPKSPLAKIKITKPKRRVINPYTPAQIEKMLAVCDWDYQHNARFVGSRNRAILLLFLDTGLRLSELAGIRLESIDTERGWIRVLGKGSKERVVRMGKVSQKALWRYLLHRPTSNYHELWLTEEGIPLRSSGVQSAFGRIKQRAGINEPGGCHRMRHTFALSFLREDRNPFNLQYLLGHSSLEMVRHYTATLGMEDALEAHIKASPGDLLISKGGRLNP